MTERKQTSLGRKLLYGGIALLILGLWTDGVAGLGLLVLIIGLIVSFTQSRRKAED